MPTDIITESYLPPLTLGKKDRDARAVTSGALCVGCKQTAGARASPAFPAPPSGQAGDSSPGAGGFHPGEGDLGAVERQEVEEEPPGLASTAGGKRKDGVASKQRCFPGTPEPDLTPRKSPRPPGTRGRLRVTHSPTV